MSLVGMRLKHPRLGRGTVIRHEPMSAAMCGVLVKFDVAKISKAMAYVTNDGAIKDLKDES